MRNIEEVVEPERVLKPYVMSKWKCPTHGYYTAKTPPDLNFSANNPIHCPDCIPELLDQCNGKSILQLPQISKPRWPSRVDNSPRVSDNAPLHKRALWR